MEKVWLTMEEKLIMWCEKAGDVYDRLQYIKEHIKWEGVTEYVLEQWAMLLKASVFEEEDISDIDETARDILEAIFKEERNYYLRLNNGTEYIKERTTVKGGGLSLDYVLIEIPPIYEKWQKLRSFYCGVFPDSFFSLSDKVKDYCQEIGLVEADVENTENSQENKEKAVFRLKYDGYFGDIETFFEDLKTIKGKELKAIFGRLFAKSDVTFKDFFKDCQTIVPERNNERGWNYEAIKKY